MRREFTITNEDKGWLIRKHAARFRGAFLSETMGPHYKPIVWVVRGGVKVPHVCTSHSHAAIRKLLNQ